MSRLVACAFVLTAMCAGSSIACADDGFRLLQIDGHELKWGEPVLGKGATITYAVIAGSSAIRGNINCLHVGGIEPLLTRSQITPQAFDRELKGALAMWQSAANVEFRPTKRPAAANIVFASEIAPEGIAYADVAFDLAKKGIVSRLKKGIVCLNPNIRWTAVQSDSNDAARATEEYRLRYTLAHELGHVLGLDHPGPEGELMSFEYGSKFNGLKQGDIAGIGTLYGRRSQVPVLALNSKTASVR